MAGSFSSSSLSSTLTDVGANRGTVSISTNTYDVQSTNNAESINRNNNNTNTSSVNFDDFFDDNSKDNNDYEVSMVKIQDRLTEIEHETDVVLGKMRDTTDENERMGLYDEYLKLREESVNLNREKGMIQDLLTELNSSNDTASSFKTNDGESLSSGELDSMMKNEDSLINKYKQVSEEIEKKLEEKNKIAEAMKKTNNPKEIQKLSQELSVLVEDIEKLNDKKFNYSQLLDNYKHLVKEKLDLINEINELSSSLLETDDPNEINRINSKISKLNDRLTEQIEKMDDYYNDINTYIENEKILEDYLVRINELENELIGLNGNNNELYEEKREKLERLKIEYNYLSDENSDLLYSLHGSKTTWRRNISTLKESERDNNNDYSTVAEKIVGTTSMTIGLLGEGFLGAFEGVGDGILTVGAWGCSIVDSIHNAIVGPNGNQWNSSEAVQKAINFNVSEWLMKPLTDNKMAQSSVYGKDSFFGNIVKGFGKGAGYIVLGGALSTAAAGSTVGGALNLANSTNAVSIAAGSSAFGQGVQSGLNNGNGLGMSTLGGVGQAVVEGGLTYGLGRIFGPKGDASELNAQLNQARNELQELLKYPTLSPEPPAGAQELLDTITSLESQIANIQAGAFGNNGLFQLGKNVVSSPISTVKSTTTGIVNSAKTIGNVVTHPVVSIKNIGNSAINTIKSTVSSNNIAGTTTIAAGGVTEVIEDK